MSEQLLHERVLIVAVGHGVLRADFFDGPKNLDDQHAVMRHDCATTSR